MARATSVAAKSAGALLAAALVAGCGDLLPDWIGAAEEPPLPGERISVLKLESSISPDPRIADLEVRLPPPYSNEHWPQAGGYAAHAMHHLAIGENLRPAWSADIGEAADGESRILASPVVAAGVVYTMDANAQVSALRAEDGRLLWRVSLAPENEEDGELGGGIAYYGQRLYAATGYGEVLALDPRDGSLIWRNRIGIPIRAEPTVSAGLVFVLTYDNQLHALATETGEVVWTHVGIAEVAGLVGAASVAAAGGLVVAPYSSGELFAFRAENGRIAWSDSLTRTRRVTGLSELSDINGRPVIDRGRVYAIGHAGRMVSIDLRTGERVWGQEIGGVQMPWVAGGFIYVLTTENDLVCLTRREGRIRWVRRLRRYKDPEDRRGPIQWFGPVLAGDRLIVVSSDARAVSVSPYTGEVLGTIRLSDPASVAPVVAEETLYILTDDARIVAWR